MKTRSKVRFVISTKEFGKAIYIAPLNSQLGVEVTEEKAKAQQWTIEDIEAHQIFDKVAKESISIKLYTYRHLLGWSSLKFERI